MTERVTIADVRAAGFCLSGARKHCQAVGVDFRRLVREGIPLSEVETIDDELVQRIVATTRERGEN
jgi:hypothetical protein